MGRSISKQNVLLVLGLCTVFAVTLGAASRQLRSADADSFGPRAGVVVDTSRLREIERRVLPATLVPGPAQHDTLAAYYWAANRELRERLEQARAVYEAGTKRPYRAVTLVAGAAGVGKSFLKDEVFRKDYPADAVAKFDIKERYAAWQAEGQTVSKPDLACGSVVLNQMLSAADPQQSLLAEYLQAKPAAFYIIDSLDEIHPDDYSRVLQQIESFALGGKRDFVHVVVFGRSLAFADHWRKKAEPITTDQLALFVLNPPAFRTTGDLLVSSWNYHSWKYKLKWAPDGAEASAMPLAAYGEWSEQGFLHSGKFATVTSLLNESMTPAVRDALADLAQSQRTVGCALYNLAGNALLREIVEQRVREHRPFEESAFMAAYLQEWLERETASENRPSAQQPQHLDLYLRLLEGVAVKILVEGRLDDQGHFSVTDTEVLELDDQGRRLAFPIRRILEHSGLKHFDPRQAGSPRYRFEPFWMQRLLVEMHNERVRRNGGVDCAAHR